MKVLAFDLDGTLSAPRQKISQPVYDELTKLAATDVQVCVVTGSPLEYIRQQGRDLWKINGYNPLLLLPCNGTHSLEVAHGKTVEIARLDMRDKIGETAYRFIVRRLVGILGDIHQLYSSSRWPDNVPACGTFIQYRGSMINWSIPGRDAGPEDRSMFVRMDNVWKAKRGVSIREQAISELKNRLGWSPPEPFKSDHIEAVLGGETSIDIYPTGWDKSYILNLFDDGEMDEVFFIGDKCTGQGNDRALYDKLDEQHRFQTDGPEKTIEIIRSFL